MSLMFNILGSFQVKINQKVHISYQDFDFKPETYQEPKKLAELLLGAWNFCGDFNARIKE